jgi:nucleoside-diphosphate-sugar epimerase
MQRVIVLGATGFVGRTVVQLLQKSYDVVGIDIVPPPTSVDGWTYQQMDLRQSAPDFSDAIAVVNCVAYVGKGYAAPGRTLLETFTAGNVDTVRRVLDALVAQASRARLVHISSSSVYIDEVHPSDRLGVRECSALPAEHDLRDCCLGCYAHTKAEADRLVAEYAARRGVRALVLRPRAVYGEGVA